MYQKILDITDELFRDVEMTEEAQVLKEELTADLNERFADLLAGGVSEDEAARQIRADLADFGELTKRFPHRQRSLTPIAPDTFPALNVMEIRVNLGSDDLEVLPSEDQQIHLELIGGDGAQWHSEMNGGRLALEIVRPEETYKKPEQQPDNLSGWLLRTLNVIATRISQECCHGIIRVPAGWRRAMEITSGSGDVGVNLPLDTLTLRTGSGDVDVYLFEGCRQARINTASGDANVKGAAGTITVGTASGDISLTGSTDALRITTASGDAELTQVKTGSLECKMTSGDFEFQGEAREIDYKSVSGDVDIILHGAVERIHGSTVSGDAEIRLADAQPASAQASSVSGDIRLSCQEGPGAVKIKLNSVSGDITVV